MKESALNALAATLRRRRDELFDEVTRAEMDLQDVVATPESEVEEKASEERTVRLLSRLEERGKREIEEIDAALRRMEEHCYGACASCAGPIESARLHALPTATFCIECARERERVPVPHPQVESAPAAPLPVDLGDLADREVEEALWEQIRAHGTIDADELRIVCRHGVAHLDGALPSEGERQVLLHLLTDVIGLAEVDDRLQIKGAGLWEKRPVRTAPPETPAGHEPASTSNLALSDEEGIDYEPSTEPEPEEQ
jgi:RNA polymerase-binding protein DksA